MGRKIEKTSQTVLSYLADERWHNLPSLTLAKKIHSDNPDLYDEPHKATERLRDIIRYWRGQRGVRERDIVSTTEFFTNKYDLPESDETDWYPFRLPKLCDNILFLSDIHFPYQNNQALEIALQYGVDEKINTVFLNGDVMDCYQGSTFVKDYRKRDLAGELEMTRQFLDVLNKLFPNAYIFFKPGNHEERWERYLMTKAPELLNVKEFRLDVLLRFGERSIHTITTPQQIIMAGDLVLIHGHEYGGGYRGAVNPARGLFLKAKRSCIAGHHHQTSEHTESDIHGEIATCWSVGCLSELHPEYLRLNKWNHGFAHIRINNSNFKVRNIRIIDNQIV